MDTFLEKIVVRKKGMKDYMLVGGIIFAGIVLFMVASMVQILASFIPILIVGVIYGVYYFITSRNIEFEYIVTNGHLDIDTIISQRKRKRIFSAHCKDFDTLGKYNRFGAKMNENNVKQIEAVSAMESNDVYYITLNYKGSRTVVYFEPDERMLNAFKGIIPRKVNI